MIELLIINSLFIFGVYRSMQPNMILSKIGDTLYIWNEFGTNFQKFISKPLGVCPVCMASVYGFPVYWIYYLLNPSNIFDEIIIYLCYSFALAGLNYIIMNLIYD